MTDKSYRPELAVCSYSAQGGAGLYPNFISVEWTGNEVHR
jgi:hypothetical protein